MKTRLPKSLLIALTSTMLCATTIASAANVADVSGTVTYTGFHDTLSSTAGGHPNATVIAPEYVGSNVEEIQAALIDKETKSGTRVRPVVFDTTNNTEIAAATIKNWGDADSAIVTKSGLFVREGELSLTDCNISTNIGSYQTNLQVGGNNAHLILDNTKLKSASGSTDIAIIGGPDGAGKLTLQNESELYVNTWFKLGASQDADSAGKGNSLYATYNSTTTASGRFADGQYTEDRGAFNAYNSGHNYGKATLYVTGQSILQVGGGVSAREADIILTDGSLLETCITSPSSTTPVTGNDNYIDLLGRGSGSQTNVLIEKGAKWHSHACMGAASKAGFEAKVYMEITGDGSELIVDKTLTFGYGSTSWPEVVSSEIYVKDGGKISAGKISMGTNPERNGATPVYVYIDSKSSMVSSGNITVYDAIGNTDYKYGGSTFSGNFEGFEVNLVNEGTITCASMTMNGGNLYSTGTIDITGEMTLIGGSITLGISEANTEKAAITAGDVIVATADNADYVIQLTALENLKAGKYLLLETEEDTSDTTGTSGKLRATAAPEAKLVFSGLEGMNGLTTYVDETGNVYLVLDEQLLLTRDPQADAIQAANWGVYKSSQAFTSLLWAPRTNAVVVKDTANGKSSILSTAAKGRTLAWGSVYSSFARHSSSGAFAGAEYSIFGGAIGVERQFASGRSVGAAFGYDWGKTSPFTTSRVDQDSWHAALYGRAAEWKLGKKGSVAIDWSAAVGSTTSEHKALGSDWTQENIQLDARATYSYALTDRTELSAFVGAQYYAQNDDSTEKVKADSLQNLRLMLGAGISHKLTEKTTLFGEAMIYNDSMRHNPDAMIDGFNYGSGANPGRLGGSVTAGAQYQLTPDWTLRGSYSYEGAEDNNEHRVNVGAVYSF